LVLYSLYLHDESVPFGEDRTGFSLIFFSSIVPGVVFEFAKFFGSGVILATALIHLLEPAADDELGPANTIALGGCISNDWSDYPYAVSQSFKEA
jgi:hypothetical protein